MFKKITFSQTKFSRQSSNGVNRNFSRDVHRHIGKLPRKGIFIPTPNCWICRQKGIFVLFLYYFVFKVSFAAIPHSIATIPKEDDQEATICCSIMWFIPVSSTFLIHIDLYSYCWSCSENPKCVTKCLISLMFLCLYDHITYWFNSIKIYDTFGINDTTITM